MYTIRKKNSNILDFEGFVAMVFISASDGSELSFWTLEYARERLLGLKRLLYVAGLSIDLVVLYLGW